VPCAAEVVNVTWPPKYMSRLVLGGKGTLENARRHVLGNRASIVYGKAVLAGPERVAHFHRSTDPRSLESIHDHVGKNSHQDGRVGNQRHGDGREAHQEGLPLTARVMGKALVEAAGQRLHIDGLGDYSQFTLLGTEQLGMVGEQITKLKRKLFDRRRCFWGWFLLLNLAPGQHAGKQIAGIVKEGLFQDATSFLVADVVQGKHDQLDARHGHWRGLGAELDTFAFVLLPHADPTLVVDGAQATLSQQNSQDSTAMLTSPRGTTPAWSFRSVFASHDFAGALPCEVANATVGKSFPKFRAGGQNLAVAVQNQNVTTEGL